MSAENAIIHAVQARAAITLPDKIDALAAAAHEIANELIQQRSQDGLPEQTVRENGADSRQNRSKLLPRF